LLSPSSPAQGQERAHRAERRLAHGLYPRRTRNKSPRTRACAVAYINFFSPLLLSVVTRELSLCSDAVRCRPTKSACAKPPPTWTACWRACPPCENKLRSIKYVSGDLDTLQESRWAAKAMRGGSRESVGKPVSPRARAHGCRYPCRCCSEDSLHMYACVVDHRCWPFV
jgi:hypothetical protein